MKQFKKTKRPIGDFWEERGLMENFPSRPIGDFFRDNHGAKWIWNGKRWVAESSFKKKHQPLWP